MKILVIRNDKLGDFMLAWPAISLLKRHYPEASITALVPAYTRPMAELCTWIDDIIIDDKHVSVVSDAIHLSRLIKNGQFDVSISMFSEMRTAMALWLAGVPVRVGPATKLAQIFLNHRLRQKRSLSLKPEHEYNTDLSRYFVALKNDTGADPAPPPHLDFAMEYKRKLRSSYLSEHHLPDSCSLVCIHPGSGGSAINLTLEQFSELARLISASGDTYIVITAGPDEIDAASKLKSMTGLERCAIYHSTQGLAHFAEFISICDLFISGSTGPLHIAGALNVATVAFYPARRSATSLRWQTLNEEGKRLAFMPAEYSGKNDMQTIDIEACAVEINSLLERLSQ